MIDLDLWFPEDFDKRYAKYRGSLNDVQMPEPFLVDRFEKAREDLLLITDETEYQNEIDKWKPLKIIVDAIYKELSPFAKKAQDVKIDLTKLSISRNQASPILLMLVYERVCRWRLTNPGIISNVPAMEYLNGNIVVPDFEKFQELRRGVNDFYKFLESQKEQKFPKIKTSEPSEDSKGEKVSEIKMIGKWGGVEAPVQPIIEYNDVTGKGNMNSVRGLKEFTFKDGSPEYNVFNRLYAKLGKGRGKLERLEVLVAGGFYEDHQQKLDPARKTAETAHINEIAKNIREKTGLNTKELVLNSGNLTLLATKSGKTPPKTTKFTPVWG